MSRNFLFTFNIFGEIKHYLNLPCFQPSFETHLCVDTFLIWFENCRELKILFKYDLLIVLECLSLLLSIET